jgi:transmembrane sensor
MTKPDHRLEGIDPLQGEALARVRHLGSGQATREEIEDTKQWGRRTADHEAALAQASLLWDRLGPAGRNLLQRRGETALPGWNPIQSQRGVSRRAMLGGALAAFAAGYALLRPPLGAWPSLSNLLADYRTTAGEQRKLTIGGGVTVTLNTQTSLNVWPQGGETDRIEVLTGEVAVATDAASETKVIVVAGDGEARARRARFNVRRGGKTTCVACLMGEVDVVRGGRMLTLGAAQQVVYASDGLGPPSPSDPVRVSAWQDGLLIFHYTPLFDVVAELNRYRPGKIFVLNSELGNRVVNGRFRIDNVDGVMTTLQDIFGAKMTRLPGGIVLLS